MDIIAGPSSEKLGADVSKALDSRPIGVLRRVFPDGEEYLRLSRPVRSKTVAIIQTLYPSNEALLQLAFLADAAREQGAKRIIAVCPYLAYSRQHKHYLPNDEISVRAVAKIMGSFCDRLITFDLHDKDVLSFFGIPVTHLTAAALLGEYGNRLRLRKPFVLGADQERPEFVKAVAKNIGCDHDYLVKRRDRKTGDIKTFGRPAVKGKDVFLVDDIISTGHSIAEAAKMARRAGAASVAVAGVHAILAQGALESIRASGVRTVAATDSIQSAVSKIPLAQPIATALRAL
jgi:ribose-phosphate pyrophosphokinase